MIVVGERLAAVPGGLTAAVRAAAATGARLVWIPRRAGERGAIEAGALPSLLPGGRPATDPRARDEVAAAWGLAELPHRYGRDTGQILEAAASGELQALRRRGRRGRRPARPGTRACGAGRGRLRGRRWSCGPARSPSTPTSCCPWPRSPRRPARFLNWEGRVRPFEAALKPDQMTRRLGPSDARVLQMLADAMDVHLGLPDLRTARAELDRLGACGPGRGPPTPWSAPAPLPRPAAGRGRARRAPAAARPGRPAAGRRGARRHPARGLRAPVGRHGRRGGRRGRRPARRHRPRRDRSNSRCRSPRCPTGSSGCR